MSDHTEIYISVDVEATGPIPGDYSLSSFGAFVAGARKKDGTYGRFDRHDEGNLFYIELTPITDKFIPAAIKVGLLEGFTGDDFTGERRHQWMKDHGQDPKEAMEKFAAWVLETKERLGGARPVFVAYPASFDWMFIYWYFIHFGVESPFGFSGVRDLKEMYATKANVPLSRATKRNMPKHLLKSDVAHTHHALDDAIGQGHLTMNLLEWKP
ncbi:hypothetical protein CLAFUW4_07761 [Fulvia fulva]|uniref:3'-5' exoribonuclease Rv2179c-like domain-containing protein n=1 Tax=Passalora fulva TaxID=5499 RepID=A0A9Q8LD63_PASFU|nr:uncharacterized protein CLAFUR5_07886 [Fulvia fulva]KAK4629053.1 hypothetical protein CLAFUR4_07766 [Fulvia fulva]KAK4630110.1 hypothetical protein CLAFUR0_07764 [Fulvia fulva]UJO15205.1 hypothetical protein CLAFUR5_07886 [Fulvia fulva]WPV12824.1 hypothetical protein CLAFUW4_07761 [Fulvia fulva]WPV27210.1 hypothetical protein CLAFUW7_07762 [Fulvia fulva]